MAVPFGKLFDFGETLSIADFCSGYIFVLIVNYNVCVLTDFDCTLWITAEDFCRICRTNLNCSFKCNLTAVCCVKHIRIKVFNTRTTVWNLCKIILTPILFVTLERTTVGCNRINKSCLERSPQSILTFLTFHRRWTYKVSAVLTLVNIAGKFKVLRTGFNVNFMALCLCLNAFFKSFLVCHMNNVKRCFKVLCPMHCSFICLCLNKFRSAKIMIPCACFSLF